MKKFLVLLIISLTVFSICRFSTKIVSAEEINLRNEGVVTSENLSYDNDDTIVVTSANSSNAVFTVSSGHTVELDGVNLSIDSGVSGNILFKVESGGTLILKNMNLATYKGSVGIENLGLTILDNVTFSGLTNTAIRNIGSETDDSLILKTVLIPTIHLESGFITVTEDTNINSFIELSLGSTKMSSASLLVRGDGTLANYYFDKFKYADTEYESEAGFDSPLDYIGDNYVKTGETDPRGKGDIVFSTYSYFIPGSPKIYYGGAYCTANRFLDTLSGNYTMKYYGVDDVVALNNYEMLSSTQAQTLNLDESSIEVSLKINICLDSIDNVCSYKSIKIYNNQSKAVFIDKPENSNYSSYSIKSAGITLTKDFENTKFIRPIITANMSSYTNEINVLFESNNISPNFLVTKSDKIDLVIPDNLTIGEEGVNLEFTLPSDLYLEAITHNGNPITPTVNGSIISFLIDVADNNEIVIICSDLVEVKLDGEFCYNGINQINNLKPYYTSSEFPLEFNLYYNGNLTSEFKNAGNYVLNITSSISGVRFVNSTIDIEMNKLAIDITPKSFVIDYGNSCELVETYLVNSTQESITLTYEREVGENVGKYDLVSVSTTNTNYTVSFVENSGVDKFTINKATIDETLITFEDMTVIYDGTNHMLVCTYPESVTCVYSTTGYTNAGVYEITVTVSNINDNYNSLVKTEYKAILTINKATYDMTAINFDDMTVTYNKSEYTHIIDTANLPSGVTVTYTNNKHTNVGTYDVVAHFTGDIDNYELIPDMESKLIINPKLISISLDKPIGGFVYNGENQTVNVKLTGVIDGDTVNVSLSNNIKKNAGEYDVVVNGIDNDNYELESVYLEKFIIEKAEIDLDTIIFADTTVEYDGELKYIYAEIPDELVGVVIINYDFEEGFGAKSYVLPNTYTINAFITIKEPNNYKTTDSLAMSAELVIEKGTIDESLISFVDSTVVYTGTPQMIECIYPYNVTCTYSTTGYTEVGEYVIIATVSPINENFKPLTKTEYTAKLIITKATYEIPADIFPQMRVEYDKVEFTHALDETKLPDGVTVTYINNKHTNAGEYTVVAYLTGDTNNYEAIPNIESKLIIDKKPISISLNIPTNGFVYNGTNQTVTVKTEGVKDGDIVNVTLSNNVKKYAGTYTVVVEGIDNNNYCVSSTVLEKFVIKKANIEMNVSIKSVEFTYDGNIYEPSIIGDIPETVEVIMHYPTIKNVGTYTVVAEFIVDSNYNKPNNLEATIVVTPKPIFVKLKEDVNYIANGKTINASVIFEGVLTGDVVGYNLSYLPSNPVLAGNYTVIVALKPNSNYVISGSNTLNLVVMSETKVYEDDKIHITATGGGFLPDTELSVEVSNDLELSEFKSTLNSVEKFNRLKICLDGAKESEPITISLKTKMVNLNNAKNIKLYKISDGELIEIEYKVENDSLVFEASNLDEFILVENQSSMNISLIIILITLAVLAVSGAIVTIVLIRKKKHK